MSTNGAIILPSPRFAFCQPCRLCRRVICVYHAVLMRLPAPFVHDYCVTRCLRRHATLSERAMMFMRAIYAADAACR